MATAAVDPLVMVRTGQGGYRSEIEVADHTMVADEPVSSGGKSNGPTPYDYLLAGLGACTGMTLRMYADRKGWPLEEAVVRLRHSRNHKTDCENCELPDARIDHVAVEIELVGSLEEAQRERLMQIARQCPVHRTLKSGFHIEIAEAAG